MLDQNLHSLVLHVNGKEHTSHRIRPFPFESLHKNKPKLAQINFDHSEECRH